MFQQLFIVAVLAVAAVVVLRLVQALRGRALDPRGQGPPLARRLPRRAADGARRRHPAGPRRRIARGRVLDPDLRGDRGHPQAGADDRGGRRRQRPARPVAATARCSRSPAATGIVTRSRHPRPVTPRLAERIALVDRTNAAFPRGVDFPAQVDRADFDSAWGAARRRDPDARGGDRGRPPARAWRGIGGDDDRHRRTQPPAHAPQHRHQPRHGGSLVTGPPIQNQTVTTLPNVLSNETVPNTLGGVGQPGVGRPGVGPRQPGPTLLSMATRVVFLAVILATVLVIAGRLG